MRRLLAVLLLSIATPGCAWVLWPFRGVPPALVDVPSDELPLLRDDFDRHSLEIALQRSIEFYEREAQKRFVVGGSPYSGGEFAVALRRLLQNLPDAGHPAALASLLRSSFRVLRATGQRRPIHFTGYYTPVLRGSLRREGPYQQPIYGRPPDLVSVDISGVENGCPCANGRRSARLEGGSITPYYTRAEIERDGKLSGRGLEIAWTDDPIGLFFLHIQGSGQLRLPDHTAVQLNYAGTNGRRYQSIGRHLAERGALPPGGGSMQSVRAYLERHPSERDEILRTNPRYTFFRVATTGPIGSTQVEVTPGRTIATDPAVFPPGALAYIRTRMPVVAEDGTLKGFTTLERLVLNQDTGGAITGPARVDVYFGIGDLYILVPPASRPAASIAGAVPPAPRS
jgi:membrane-bound lytic murein transglycosylase A